MNTVLMQGRLEITQTGYVQIDQESVLQVEAWLHVGQRALGGRHLVRFVDAPARVISNWLKNSHHKRMTDLPEVFVEGALFTPESGRAYVLGSFVRFVGTKDLIARIGNSNKYR